MADILDQADEAAELFRRAALSKRQPVGPAPTGECLNCQEPLNDGRRWCCAECRDDFLARNKRGSA